MDVHDQLDLIFTTNTKGTDMTKGKTKTELDAAAAELAVEAAYAAAELPKHFVRPVAANFRRGTRIA